MALTHYIVKARRPERAYENGNRYWMDIGIATVQPGGDILVTLNALPLDFDGELRLKVQDKPAEGPEGPRSKT